MTAPNTIENFYSFIPHRPKEGCWNWIGYKHNKGYGVFRFKGKVWRSHRLSWVRSVADIPEGLCVCHSCDNPSCCNPDHLFLGTHDDNMADMTRKGRQANRRGNRNTNVRLTDDDVLKIRDDPREGMSIATEYRISRGMVSRIKNRKRWAHV